MEQGGVEIIHEVPVAEVAKQVDKNNEESKTGEDLGSEKQLPEVVEKTPTTTAPAATTATTTTADAVASATTAADAAATTTTAADAAATTTTVATTTAPAAIAATSGPLATTTTATDAAATAATIATVATAATVANAATAATAAAAAATVSAGIVQEQTFQPCDVKHGIRKRKKSSGSHGQSHLVHKKMHLKMEYTKMKMYAVQLQILKLERELGISPGNHS